MSFPLLQRIYLEIYVSTVSVNFIFIFMTHNVTNYIYFVVNSFDLKKLKLTIDNMYMEKQKVEKGDKTKKSKGKGKAKLRMEGDNALMNQYGAYDYDDYDDFM